MTEVPKRALLSGEGLDRLTDEQTRNLADFLHMFGIRMEMIESESDLAALASDLRESESEISFSKSDFADFADLTGAHINTSSRVWNRLVRIYVNNRDYELFSEDSEWQTRRVRKDLGCPIEFYISERARSVGNSTPIDLLTELKADTLVPAAKWILSRPDNERIEDFGPSSIKFLVNFVNAKCNPDVPLEAPEPGRQKDIAVCELPCVDADQFEVDQESPYVEILEVDGETRPFITIDCLYRLATDMDINPARLSSLWSAFLMIADQAVRASSDIDYARAVVDKKASTYVLSANRPIRNMGVSVEAVYGVIKNAELQDNKIYKVGDMTRFLFGVCLNEIILKENQ